MPDDDEKQEEQRDAREIIIEAWDIARESEKDAEVLEQIKEDQKSKE